MKIHRQRLFANQNGEVVLRPFGDVQLGSRACDLEKARAFIKEGMQEEAYWIGMGDYVDFANPSDRKRLRAALLNDTSSETIIEAAYRIADQFLDLTKGTEGKWLGLLEGHHFCPLKEATSDSYIAGVLEAPFLGTTTLLVLDLPWDDTIIVWAHHGAGSGKGIAAPLARLEEAAAGFDADIYLMGHYHKRAVASIDVLGTDEERLAASKKWLICTGSYLRSYQEEEQGAYAERGLLRPVSLGGVSIRLQPKGERGTRVGVEMWEY